MKFDVVIVGAGPAGSTVATLLSQKGINVLLVDAKVYPREKPCAELISKKAYTLINDIFGFDLESSIYSAVSNEVSLYSGPQLLSEVTSHSETFYVDRKQFDYSLVQSAISAGAIFHDNRKVVRYDPINCAVYFNNGEKLHAAMVVGADGALSIIARTIYGRLRKYKENTAIGLSVKVPRDCVVLHGAEERYLWHPNIYFTIVNWGYAWVFPNKEYLNIGVAGRIYDNPNIKKTYLKFLGILPISFDLPVSPKGHPIPFGKERVKLGKSKTILVGDAAGLVEPVTGEGIYFAIKSGELAARAIFSSELNPEHAIVNYKALCNSEIVRYLNQAYFSRNLLFGRFFHRKAMKALSKDKYLSERFMDLLSGEITYIEYFKNALCRKLL